MRKLLLFPILIVLCLVASCTKGGSSSTSSATPVIDSLAQYRDTMVGNFNGSQIDTLICEPIDNLSTDSAYGGWHYLWKVYSAQGTVKDLIIDNTTGIHFTNMGDLDFDGADEFGFVTEWPTSNWMNLRVYSYKNGNGRLLYEPQGIWLPHIEKEDDYYAGYCIKDLTTAYKPDSVKVKYSTVINDGEDFVVLDTILPILK